MIVVAVAIGLHLGHRHSGGGGRGWIPRDYEKLLRKGRSRRLKMEGMYFALSMCPLVGDKAMREQDPTLLVGAGTRLRMSGTPAESRQNTIRP